MLHVCTKEAIIAKEHQNDIEATIFYLDIRAFGKGFDQYYERAKSEYGIRYIKSFVSRILEDPATKDVEIVYVDESGDLKSEQFDLIVLSVGTRPSEHLSRLADVLNIELNDYGFVKTSQKSPLVTSREGIYVSGAVRPRRISRKQLPGQAVRPARLHLLSPMQEEKILSSRNCRRKKMWMLRSRALGCLSATAESTSAVS